MSTAGKITPLWKSRNHNSVCYLTNLSSWTCFSMPDNVRGGMSTRLNKRQRELLLRNPCRAGVDMAPASYHVPP